MKLNSKEMCPTTIRDRLIKTFSNQDVCDLVEAVKWAEEKCLELDKLCFKLTGENDYLIGENEELKKSLSSVMATLKLLKSADDFLKE